MENNKLITLMVNVMESTKDPYLFENYTDFDRGIKNNDYDFKIIIEKIGKKYFISFNTIKEEITKEEFTDLSKKWEVGKEIADKFKLNRQQQIDTIALKSIYREYNITN